MSACLSNPTAKLKEIFRQYNITKEKFEAELSKVKTNRVTGDNPEETYDALNKYGFDLVGASLRYWAKRQSRHLHRQ